jgi:hypothetical protein
MTMRLIEFTAGRSPRDSKLIPVGYWQSSNEPDLPMPDSNDSVEHEAEIVHYLKNNREINAYRGSSPCRICDKRNNGSKEMSDGIYIWPQGLAHYVEEHKTTLPPEFVQHILDNPVEDKPEPQNRGFRASSW